MKLICDLGLLHAELCIQQGLERGKAIYKRQKKIRCEHWQDVGQVIKYMAQSIKQ